MQCQNQMLARARRSLTSHVILWLLAVLLAVHVSPDSCSSAISIRAAGTSVRLLLPLRGGGERSRLEPPEEVRCDLEGLPDSSDIPTEGTAAPGGNDCV